MKITVMCPTCGTIRTPQDSDNSCEICDYCGEKRIKIDFDPDAFLSGLEQDREIKKLKIYRHFLYNNAKFNEEKFEERTRKEKEESLAFKKILGDFTPDLKPHCPICNSVNLSKISSASKVGKIAMFGIFGMGDNGKTWKCNNCGSKF